VIRATKPARPRSDGATAHRDYYAALAELEAVIGADLNLFPSTKTKEAK